MKPQRFDEYHKHGCHFFGKLVVVDYSENMEKDPKWKQWNAGVSFKYLERAKAIVSEHYGTPKRVLLEMPDYVVEIE